MASDPTNNTTSSANTVSKNNTIAPQLSPAPRNYALFVTITALSLIFAWFAYRLSPLADMVKK
ncbi:MAG: hypothetical protein K2M93_07690 [Muribaculaceae bacterium]|nr:hypothetical protein [Muribaculaceae bacterium]